MEQSFYIDSCCWDLELLTNITDASCFHDCIECMACLHQDHPPMFAYDAGLNNKKVRAIFFGGLQDGFYICHDFNSGIPSTCPSVYYVTTEAEICLNQDHVYNNECDIGNICDQEVLLCMYITNTSTAV